MKNYFKIGTKNRVLGKSFICSKPFQYVLQRGFYLPSKLLEVYLVFGRQLKFLKYENQNAFTMLKYLSQGVT